MKLEKCKAEQKEISGQQEGLLGQLKQKSDEAHAICNGLIELQQQFDQSVAKDAPYRARLYKLYNKKLKLPKKKRTDQAPANDGSTANLPQNEWADDSESSSSLSDLSNLSDDDDDEVDETKPPEGVSQELFDAVLGLREKKRALDVQLQAIQEQADALQGQAGQLAKKEKAILTNKQAAQAELTGFRSQKQQELNGIQTNCLVYLDQYSILRPRGAPERQKPLSFEQLQNLPPEELEIDPDLSDALLFSKKLLARLENR